MLRRAATRARTLSTGSPALLSMPSTCRECSRAYSPSMTKTATAWKLIVGFRVAISDSSTSASSRWLAALATSSMSRALDWTPSRASILS